MMGTAFEGPDQGSVRFEIEIASDGSLTRLETLWSTSPKAEALARAAVDSMPPLPPTPTGQPLVFRKTISFQPFATDVPPLYKDDCLPDPPVFRNPYAWDGKSAQGPAVQPSAAELDPDEYEECLKQLPEDSIEAEAANDRRQLERWRSPHLEN
jgi:TonB family protein